jgi:predicted acyl esterase
MVLISLRKVSVRETMMEEGYIVVYQDVRGRWMSDGLYDNMRAYPNKKIKTDVDEASDTYDTIDWLKNTDNNNGNVGIWEFHTRVLCYLSLLSRHPALKAVSPQACISDFSLMIFTITEPIY